MEFSASSKSLQYRINDHLNFKIIGSSRRSRRIISAISLVGDSFTGCHFFMVCFFSWCILPRDEEREPDPSAAVRVVASGGAHCVFRSSDALRPRTVSDETCVE